MIVGILGQWLQRKEEKIASVANYGTEVDLRAVVLWCALRASEQKRWRVGDYPSHGPEVRQTDSTGCVCAMALCVRKQ